MLGGQDVRAGSRIVFHDAARHDRAEPLSNVALVQLGALGELRARGGTLRRGFEEAGLVTDVHHQRQHAARVVSEEPSREFLNPLPIKFHRASLSPPRRSFLKERYA